MRAILLILLSACCQDVASAAPAPVALPPVAYEVLAPAKNPAPVAKPKTSPRGYASRCRYTAPAAFNQHVTEAAAKYKVDPWMIAVTIYRESGCKADAVGAAGEIGLGQINWSVWGDTLRAEGIAKSKQALRNPKVNLRATAYILSVLMKASHKNVELTFRKYNGSGSKARSYGRAQAAMLRKVKAAS